MNVTHDDLEHGAELTFSENIETDKAAVQQYICLKDELGVFASRKVSQGPNYVSKDVVDQLHEMFPDLSLYELTDTKE